jgi:hypothetical protein
MQIRIVAGEVFSRKVKSSKTGKEYVFRDQMGIALMGGDSSPCKVPLQDDQAGYPVGLYDVLDASFYVDRDSRLAVGRLALRPVAEPAQAAGGAAALRAAAGAVKG